MATGPQGGLTSSTVCVHGWLSWLQQSLATQVRVKVTLQPLVIRASPVTLIVTFVPQQVSTAVGGSKLQAEPQSTVLLPAHVRVGGLAKTKMLWLHSALWPQQSVTRQVRVIRRIHPLLGCQRLVVVLTTTRLTLVPQHGELMAGGVKCQSESHGKMPLSGEQTRSGLHLPAVPAS